MRKAGFWAAAFAAVGMAWWVWADARVYSDNQKNSGYAAGFLCWLVSAQILSLMAAYWLLMRARARSGAVDKPSSAATAVIVCVTFSPWFALPLLFALAR